MALAGLVRDKNQKKFSVMVGFFDITEFSDRLVRMGGLIVNVENNS